MCAVVPSLSIIFGIISIVGLIFDADNRITWILLIMGDLAICLPGSSQIRAQYNKIKSYSDNSSNYGTGGTRDGSPVTEIIH